MLVDSTGRPLPSRPGDLAPLSSWPELPPGGWTLATIREAITSYERGYVAPAARLARALGRSARYVQARRQAIDTVLGLPLDVVGAAERGKARLFAEGARTMLTRLLAGGAEAWLLEKGEVLNLGIGQIEWNTTTIPWTPVAIHEWPLSYVRVDMYTRRIWASAEGGEVEIVPGNGRWVVYDPEGWLRWEGLIRCLGEPWYAEHAANRNLNNRASRSSVAVIDAQIPEGVAMEGADVAAYKAQLQAVQGGGAAGILRPAGWTEPRVLDLSGRDPSGIFDLAIDTAATALIVAWLGQDGTSKNEGGSLAKAQVLNGVAYDLTERRAGKFYGRLNPDGSREPGCVTSQIVRPWVLFQDGGSDDVVPLVRRIVPDLEEDARLGEEAARASKYLAEVPLLETLAGRALTATELRELAAMRGVRLPESVLARVPVAPSGAG